MGTATRPEASAQVPADRAQACATLFIAAEPREFAGILRHCREVRRLAWPVSFARSGNLNGRRVILVADGPGLLAARAVDIAAQREAIGAVVSTGYCGALDPKLETGDVIVADSGGTPRTTRLFLTGKLVTSERVVGTHEEKCRLREQGAAAVEMEGALVAQHAALLNLPYYCVRAVMDRAEETFSLDFNGLRDTSGRFSRSRILWAALRRPVQGIPDLFRLERQGRVAARALGDFIADCGF